MHRLRNHLLVTIVVLLACSSVLAQEKGQPSENPPPVKSKEGGQGEPERLSDMQLINRVVELQRELEAADVSQRDAAEKELIARGVRVLDYLEPTTDKTPTDAVQRTNRVRQTLEKIAVASVTQSSKVTLQGRMTVGQALEKISKQTQNDVALPDQTPDVFRDRSIELDVKQVEFWSAMAEVMKQGELEVDPYRGAPGQLRLGPTNAFRFEAANPGIENPNPAPVATVLPRDVSGVFDFTVTQVSTARNLANPELSYCNIHVLIRWEPRVTPISIDLPARGIEVTDEFDKPIDVPNRDAVLSGIVQPEIPELEYIIPIALVDRKITVIQSLKANINAVLPGRVETFRFKKLGNLAPGAVQTKAGATVTFDGINKNEDLFGVTVRLSFDEEHNALESHQNWVYNNSIYLEDAEGNKFEYLAYEGVTQTNNEVAIRYYFDKDPKMMTLNYKTPAAIVRVPVELLLKNIPLP